MQNKGAIRVITILFALVCIYQLSFTFFAKRVESEARDYATNAYAQQLAKARAGGNELREQELFSAISTERELAYLDSVADKSAYNFLWMRDFTYRECKARELNLGLDLKGGMNVMVEVSTSEVLKNLASNPDDPTLKTIYDNALEVQKKSTKDFVSIFAEEVKKHEEQGQKVDLATFFRVKLKERGISATSSNAEVLAAIRKECTDSYDRTFQVLSKRIDKFGVAQPTIQKLEASERILIELPGIKDPQRVNKLLEGAAQLEFWLTGDASKVLPFLASADRYLAGLASKQEEPQAEETKDSNSAEMAERPVADSNKVSATNPLTSYFAMINNGSLPSSVIGLVAPSDRDDVDSLLRKAAKVLPQDVSFLWSAKPFEKANLYELYVIRHTNKGRVPLLYGDVISDARQDFNQQGSPVVSMVMKDEAARKWGKITGANIGKSIAIVLDGVVYSAPVVNSEISGGRSEISGNFALDEAKDLANILKSGKLTAPAKVVQESIVGPSLGEESIHSGVVSFAIAFLLVLAYMIFFYKGAGIAACIALLTNIFFLFGVLASIGAVLTLPGIAGIVLTMAMAIDANVIIYERVKEELRMGRSVASAILQGYKNAYSAIIDGNVTTLLTGIVLAYFGSGPIQGFAVTLCVGLLTSLFCGIFVSRLYFEYFLARKKEVSFFTRITEHFLESPKIPFVAGIKKQFIVVAALLIIAVVSLIFKGFDYGIDFQGGRTYTVRFDKDVVPEEVRTSLAAQFGSAPEVKTFGPNYQVRITTDYKVNEDSEEVKQEVIGMLYAGCLPFYENQELTIEQFQSTIETPLGIISSEIVGPTIADDIKTSAMVAVSISLVLIFLYIFLRFRKWQYGLAALVSLAFDTVVTMGFFSLFSGILPFSLEVDQHFIAALLTVIGYSINDTVIIFDRVRENVRLYPKRPYKEIMNDSMNQTMSRTFNTLGSTLLVLIVVFIFGGEVLRGFVFTLLVGIAVGGFASLCVACPTAYKLITRSEAKELASEGNKK